MGVLIEPYAAPGADERSVLFRSALGVPVTSYSVDIGAPHIEMVDAALDRNLFAKKARCAVTAIQHTQSAARVLDSPECLFLNAPHLRSSRTTSWTCCPPWRCPAPPRRRFASRMSADRRRT